MIIVMRRQATAQNVKDVIGFVEDLGLETHMIEGQGRNVIGLIGDTAKVDPLRIKAFDNIAEVMRVSAPYKLANRAFHPENSQIKVRDQIIGGEELAIMAGPCSVEGEEHMIMMAQRMKAAGANFIRGGAFKPRSSPYSFQGLGVEGLKHLVKAREATGLPIVSELMSTEYLDVFVEMVDVIQIGARNMQNFDLLKEIGKTKTPILLKRGLTATYEEWLMSAEYIMSEGNPNVILCERGIRTYEPETRNTLDIQAVPVIKQKSHLPIIIDPSHAAGIDYLVPAGMYAGVAAGADGLIVETHNQPEKAWSDGQQCLTPDEFVDVLSKVERIAEAVDRKMPEAPEA